MTNQRSSEETMYRQGDVLIVACDEIPSEAVREKPAGGKCILAEGEATGHHHAVPASHATMYMVGMAMYLAVARACYLRHQEHGKIRLPEGKYRVIRQREYTPWGERRVED